MNKSTTTSNYGVFDANTVSTYQQYLLKQREKKVNLDPYTDPFYELDDFATKVEKELKKNRTIQKKQKPKSQYTLEECLSTYRELVEKDIGDIYLSGSVGLFIQGKLDRCKFKDLDIVVVGDFELDEEIEDYIRRSSYPMDEVSTNLKTVIFNDVLIDLFTVKNIKRIDVEYEGHTYKCQQYPGIVQAKLEMALKKLKDKDFLLKHIVDIIIH